MSTTKTNHCCGSCRNWECPGGADFKERLKFRFSRPYCRLTRQPRGGGFQSIAEE